MATPLNVQHIDGNRYAILGDLDRHTLSDNWWGPNRENGSGLYQFDLSGVSKVDSAGLAWLINLVRDSRSAGAQVVLTNVPDRLMALAKLSDADTLLPLQ